MQIARRGASVVAAEPDPYKNCKTIALPVLQQVIEAEGLDLTLVDEGIFDVGKLGYFDTILCLGLVYHFRDQQFVLDYLSGLSFQHLVISTQTYNDSRLLMMNRFDPDAGLPERFLKAATQPLSGWHSTRPMFTRMLEFAGFVDVRPLTDPSVNFPNAPLPGVTNSAYFRATRDRTIDPVASRYEYLPR